MTDYTIQEIDYLQDDITDWESTDPGNITLTHQATAVADSEANWEREHKCLRAVVSGDQSGDKIRLPLANFVDGAPSIVANAWFGFWIRASLTGASVVKGIMSSDGVEEEVTPNIATASKWQFVVADLSDLTGTMDYFELEILATESVTIEVSRVWYCNESRQVSGNSGPASDLTDEVIELTAAWFYGAAKRIYTTSLFLGNHEFYMSYHADGNEYKGCYLYDQAEVGMRDAGSNQKFKIIPSTSVNKFTGVTDCWIEKATELTLYDYISGHDLHDFNLYNCTNGIHFDFKTTSKNWYDWDHLYNINIYDSGKAVLCENDRGMGAVKNINIVGGSHGVYAYLGTIMCKDCVISSVNPPSTADLYCDYSGIIDWIIDGSTLGFNAASVTIPNNPRRCGIFVYRTANFVTSPVTQDVVIIGYNTKNTNLPTYQPFTGKKFACYGITDASGIAQLWCMWRHYYATNTSEVYSDATDKYHFKFINGDEVQATHDGDISSGIGSEGSEQSITLTPAAVAGKRMVGQDMIFS